MRTLLLFFAFISLSLSGFTQDRLQSEPIPEVEKRVEQKTEILKEQLALTGKQEVLVKKKLTEFYIERNEIINSGMSMAKKRDAIEAVVKNQDKEIRNILTGQQYEVYLNYRGKKR
ncbi:hypothetical protein [Haloflavibacter putidus]|uniref:Uncharacterized protein n=1 Tax=Haloflavibacter putidus TaxID=2576776 RepID=A0A507ZZN4_9FLAO|nr:hypothetical protein [Haloflavibacter putidus]TQD40135.1 hypothetical protein FKR84_02760 [Haloflavibacter putidus]